MSEKPFVSVIIPTWNGKDYIVACLDSVLAQDYPAFEVIVVDNASSDGTPDLVAESYPSARLIRNSRNLGFAGGVNVGLRATEAEIAALLNQDTVLNADWLCRMVAGMEDPYVGIAGCKILYPDGRTLQHAGGYLSAPQAFSHHFGNGQIDSGQFDHASDVEFVTGAACALRRCVIERIGYLDERFHFYYEDVDYCYQAREAGFRVVYLPDAVVRHYGKSALGDATSEFFTHTHTSRLQFVLKHLGAEYFLSQLCPAERTWLATITMPAERSGARQAYQNLAVHLQRSSMLSSSERRLRGQIVSALFDLRRAVYLDHLQIAEDKDCWASGHLKGEGSPTPQSPPWWQVQEQPFVSNVPFLGGCIAWIRSVFNDISTKWFVRPMLQQQNQVNQTVAGRLEQHAFILRDTDRDVVSLMLEISDVLTRLQKLEARCGTSCSWIESDGEE